MKTFLTSIFFAFILTQPSISQDLSVGFQTGIGTYSMSGLKELNDIVTEGTNFDSEIVSNFPPYWYYRPSFLVKYNKISYGSIYTFQSTGSRVSAKDYSGEYRFDMKTKSHSPGLYFEIDFASLSNVQFSFHSILGCSFSQLELTEYYELWDNTLKNLTVKYKALNYDFEPGVSVKYPYKKISFGIDAGYLLQFGNQAYYTNDNKNDQLKNPINNEPVKPDWNGLRLGASVSYTWR